MIRRAITYAASLLRRRIFIELKRIEIDPGYSIIVAHHDKPVAVLMNYDEYQSWKKTLEIASDPLLVKSSDLQNISEELKRGEILTYQEVFGKPQPHIEDVDKSEIIYRVRHGTYREEEENKI